jgi:hypothetical protein
MNPKRPLTGTAKLKRYVRLLDRARIALDDARQLYPDVGLDHAVQRLTQQLMEVSYLLPAHREAALREPVGSRPLVISQTP